MEPLHGPRLGPVADGPALYGIFAASNDPGGRPGAEGDATSRLVEVQLPDGSYPDLISGRMIEVADGRTRVPDSVIVVELDFPILERPRQSPVLDLVLHVEQSVVIDD